LSNDTRLFLSSLARLLVEFSEPAILSDVREPDELRRQAARMHKLKGVAGMLGAKGIFALASETEAACAAGDARRASGIAVTLATQLQALRESAAPVINAARAQADAAVDVADMAPKPHLIGELVDLLRQQNLSAVDRFRSLEPPLRRHLPAAAYQALRGHMDALQFDAAAEILEGNGVICDA